MTRPWTPDEKTWARECFFSGDTVEEIAEAADRDPADVRRELGGANSITPRQREVLSLYTAGATFQAIADELGLPGANNRKAPATMINKLRQRGLPIPHRRETHA